MGNIEYGPEILKYIVEKRARQVQEETKQIIQTQDNINLTEKDLEIRLQKPCNSWVTKRRC